MNFEQFQRLVRGGERATVDFKLVCNAFNKSAGDHEKAKAELVKDICAMANNGANTSYLIFGIGDDRTNIQGVSDLNFTSANIHSLVRDSIHPRPNIRVHVLEWRHAPSPFKGTRFLVIQVGPNGKYAFRFARDYIVWKDKTHFRKNEVWVRNGDTSDVGTPEQIATLLGKRTNISESDTDLPNTRYNKLTRASQIEALRRDVSTYFDELGFRTSAVTPHSSGIAVNTCFRVAIRLRGKGFIFKCRIGREMNYGGAQAVAVRDDWKLEHCLWIFLLGSFSHTARFIGNDVDVKEHWGTFNVLKPATILRVPSVVSLPHGFSDVPISVLTASRITDTKHLRELMSATLEGLENDDSIFSLLDEARTGLNQKLNQWARKSRKSITAAFPEWNRQAAQSFAGHLKSILTFKREVRGHRR